MTIAEARKILKPIENDENALREVLRLIKRRMEWTLKNGI